MCRPDSSIEEELSRSLSYTRPDGRNLYGCHGKVRTGFFRTFLRQFFGIGRKCLLPALSVLLFFSSCKNETVYHTYQAVPENPGWNRSDSLAFCLPSGLPSASYTLEVGVRNTERYEYRDLWLLLIQVPCDTLPLRADTLHLYLADKEGRWNKGGSAGHYYQSVFVYDKPFVIGTDSFNRELRIVHAMRDNPLVGISDIGIRLSSRK